MSKPSKMYECGDCGALHYTLTSAEICCATNALEVWICPTCDERHGSEQAASDCCVAEAISCPNCMRVHGASSESGIAVDVAGHCPVCNPNYTLDEQIAIEQRYKELHAG